MNFWDVLFGFFGNKSPEELWREVLTALGPDSYPDPSEWSFQAWAQTWGIATAIASVLLAFAIMMSIPRRDIRVMGDGLQDYVVLYCYGVFGLAAYVGLMLMSKNITTAIVNGMLPPVDTSQPNWIEGWINSIVGGLATALNPSEKFIQMIAFGIMHFNVTWSMDKIFTCLLLLMFALVFIRIGVVSWFGKLVATIALLPIFGTPIAALLLGVYVKATGQFTTLPGSGSMMMTIAILMLVAYVVVFFAIFGQLGNVAILQSAKQREHTRIQRRRYERSSGYSGGGALFGAGVGAGYGFANDGWRARSYANRGIREDRKDARMSRNSRTASSIGGTAMKAGTVIKARSAAAAAAKGVSSSTPVSAAVMIGVGATMSMISRANNNRLSGRNGPGRNLNRPT